MNYGNISNNHNRLYNNTPEYHLSPTHFPLFISSEKIMSQQDVTERYLTLLVCAYIYLLHAVAYGVIEL